MDKWLGELLTNAPGWVVIIVTIIVGIVLAIFYMLPVGFELPGPKSEWQKSWYKKKEVRKHGKK